MNNKSEAKTLITKTLRIFSFIKHYQGCCKMCKAAHKLLPAKVFLNNGLRSKLVYTYCLFVFTTGLTHAANLVTVDDNYGIPVSRFLQVEPSGVLDNDTLDEQNAGENGVTVILVSSVTNGTLNCPTSPGSELCADGSFDYTPGPGFSGTDSFTYQASIDVDVSAVTMVTLSACNGGPIIFTCWHKAPYLAKLSALGYSVFLEGFEGAAWEVVRSPDIGPSITASSITSKGITWTSNHPLTNAITTGSGPARTGSWGGFDPAHGFATETDPSICDVDVVPVECRPHDGLSGEILSGGDKLHAVGGYISGFTNASIAIILDATSYNVGKLPGSGHHFFAVIDASASGFSGFEFQEQDGKSGQELLIFGDDFIIATSGAVPVNNPPVLGFIGDQTVNEDVLLEFTLTASDPDDGDSWSFLMSDGPAGSSLDDNFDGTATFSWRPDFTQAGSYPLTFTVTDNGVPAETDSEAITIEVNEVVLPSGSLRFGAPSYSVNENGVSATIAVTRTGGSFGTVGVDYASSDITATAGSDYTATSGTLSLADGVLSETFTVDIFDDIIYEGNETLNLTLSNPTGGAGLEYPITASLIINENDPAPTGALQFSAPDYTVAENGTTAAITVTRTGGSTGAASVDYASINGTATAGNDYTAANGTINFGDGDAVSKTFTVSITDDASYEGDETLNLNLSNVVGASLGGQSSAMLTIIENDPVPMGSIQFSTPGYTVAENGMTATITVTRTGGSAGAASVDYADAAGGSAMPGSDYTSSSGTINFADGDAVARIFIVPVIDDISYEGDETVNLLLSNASGASLGTPSSSVLTITENEPIPPAGSLQFSAPSYTVAENGTTATITVTRVGGIFGTVGVDYDSADGSAMASRDYTAVSGSLSFADGEESQTFSVDLVDDANYEGDESLNLMLSNPTGGAGLGSPALAILTILEDEPVPASGSLQFSAASYSVAENATIATIIVTRVGGSFGLVGVGYASADGSAMASSDYTAVSGSLSFSDGVVSQAFSVDIVDDTTYEGDESLSLTLGNPTSGAGLGSPALAILTISEDDPVPPSGSLQFGAPIYSVSENGTTASITVTRMGGSLGIVGVDYASADESAMANSDYTAVSGTLSFDDGVLSQTFSVDIVDDADYEGDESFNLMLSNPTGGAGLGSPALTILTISEDDPVPPSGSLQFSATDYNVTENGDIATITVTRVGGSFGLVGVNYASADVSATAGSDYTAVIGRLSFADGVVSQTFNVIIHDDTTYEGDEMLSLTLGHPTGGAGMGAPVTASLIVIENEIFSDTGDVRTGGGGGSSIDLITLILLLSLYRRKIPNKNTSYSTTMN